MNDSGHPQPTLATILFLTLIVIVLYNVQRIYSVQADLEEQLEHQTNIVSAVVETNPPPEKAENGFFATRDGNAAYVEANEVLLNFERWMPNIDPSFYHHVIVRSSAKPIIIQHGRRNSWSILFERADTFYRTNSSSQRPHPHDGLIPQE